jgi:hypothetical protein
MPVDARCIGANSGAGRIATAAAFVAMAAAFCASVDPQLRITNQAARGCSRITH